ncbi:sarcosine oxidase subunit delta [Salipiger bermudensis]|uniref:Sarcosine oxidase, delta subunit family protein n=1 Tax=Salipiger bermudensis (strain DSM 26914 / JCM 13377 / KCTC 12554 / HTCC2601) TaxID=314265 RepID=Q0FM06_SALBH|nr:sarcosine oxidase subunit delta [Salipiger bermudensis]EAU45192.1 sarcosine oxidase, delta subunit family protein [Salipiger bermudensis HTCC2601]MBR9890460.1 sarcosine oxidase subunit delta [bacterium]
MLILHCPCCGVDAAEIELAPGGEAHLKREGPGSSDAALETYLFTRDNPRGVVLERWRHAYGCGKWFLAARDSVTMEVYGTYAAQTHAPPQEIVDRITARHPGWAEAL